MVRSAFIKALGVGLTVFVCNSAGFAQTAIDGDTTSVGGKTYDLWGIDAPEPEQQCGSWSAGREATEYLKQLISGKTVVCAPKAIDRFGVTLARCAADKADLGEAMVRDGYAWAFVDYTSDYVDEERQALESNLGVHRHGCERPWEYRERLRAK
jgi:endonuclease YncB( thermonuclease family)